MDAYNPYVAFDDHLGDAPPPVDCVGAVRAIMRSAGKRRLRAPVEVLGASYDPTASTFSVPRVMAVGADDVEQTGLPLFDSLQRRFKDALPEPKMVRVDSDASYATWKEARRQPYIARLDERLADLEAQLTAHAADHHGGGRLAVLEEAFERHVSDPNAHNKAVLGALAEVAQCGSAVPLPLPHAHSGAISCWRDGPEILCSVRMLDDEGESLIATTALPVQRALDETLGAAMAADVDPGAIVVVVPSMSHVLGGMSLVPQLCRAAPVLAGVPRPFVGILVSSTDPTSAAAMALIQRCQRGDPRACAEAGALSQARRRLVRDAEKRLQRAQRERARAS